MSDAHIHRCLRKLIRISLLCCSSTNVSKKLQTTAEDERFHNSLSSQDTG